MFQAIQRAFSKYNKKQEIVKIRLGICAMDKKARSKPMREILSRLPVELFEIVIFGDECILNKPIEEWPVVEVLIAFYSTRFPSYKALQYVALRKPFMVNDLEMDAVLKDRRKVYKILQQEGIDVPFHALCDRDDPNKVNVIEEFDEYIVVNGVQINKPLVEKPVDAEDHNIYIYYPMSAGGGSKRLFRKVDDRSSEFYPQVNDLRKDGSFIYEEFVVTQGTDVKVYTVGPDYGHAEARKSPVVDGKVNRDSAGLEVRFPVILSPLEKDIARKVVTAFKQTVCGFDILRVQGRSYCCDVNGFSFVKNSRKYYDDASQVLVELMISTTRPDLHLQLSTRAPLVRPRPGVSRGMRETMNSMPSVSSMLGISNLGGERRRSQEDANLAVVAANRRGSPSPSIEKQERSGKWSTPVFEQVPSTIAEESGRVSPSESTGSLDLEKEELRCVIGIIRHGDRTPKQKMKLMITEPRYIAYFHQYCQSPRRDLKVKSKSALLRFLEVTREVVADPVMQEENKVIWMKLKQIQDVLERWEISGINRKLQMKPEKWVVDPSITDSKAINSVSDPEKVRVVEVLLILKWGGDLTPLGCQQAEDLGESFRYAMYPDSGGGMLRLHATYRHDLKIKASDEGRVMKTAAAFAKGLLELEGQLTPILASLVTVEEKDRQMLDREGNREIKEEMDRCKEHLHLLQSDREITEELAQVIAPDCTSALKNALMKLKNPVKALQRMHALIGLMCDQLRVLDKQEEERVASEAVTALSTTDSFSTTSTQQPAAKDKSQMVSVRDSSKGTKNTSPNLETSPSGNHLYLGETLSMMLGRWEKLYKDFYSSKLGIYDLSKVPDIYDSMRYEVLHNSHLNLEGMKELYELSMMFENSVVPQEYGIDRNDKRKIGSMMCHYLLQKIKYDLMVSSSDAQTDMRYQLDSSHAEDLAISTLGRCVRTRLYFTSESHLHTLLNVLKYHGEGEPYAIDKHGEAKLDSVVELGYLTQVVIRLFEDREDTTKFRCEIMFSPGATNDPWNSATKSDLAPVVLLNRAIPCETLIACLDNAIAAGYGHDEGLDIDDELPPSGEGMATSTAHPSIHIKHDNSLNILV